MNEKRNFATFVLDVVRNVIAPPDDPAKVPAAPAPEEKKKVSLNDIPLDDLERAKTSLDHEERKVLAELEEIEKKKKMLYDKGVNGNVGDAELTIISRKMNDLLADAKGKERELQMISKEYRTLNALATIKRESQRGKDSPIVKILGNLDLGDLTNYIDQSTVDNEFNMKKFDEVMNRIGIQNNIATEYTEDRNVLQIKAMMEKARAAGQQDVDAGIKELNKLTKRENEAPEADF